MSQLTIRRSDDAEAHTPSDTILHPLIIGIVSQYLHLWDVLACRLACTRWRSAFATVIPSLAIAFPQTPSGVHQASGLPPAGLQQALGCLTLFLDDSRMGLLQELLQQGCDPWTLLLDHLRQGSQHVSRLRLRVHASLVLQYTSQDKHAMYPSIWATQMAGGWTEVLRSLKALELAVGHGRNLKAPVLHSVLAPCTALTSLSLQLLTLDSEQWGAVLLLSRLTSLSLQWASEDWPQQQQQQKQGLSQCPGSASTPVDSCGAEHSDPGCQSASNLAGLEFLALSTPALCHGLPSWVTAASGLRCLLLHGARVPYTLGAPTSGFGFLKQLTQQLQLLPTADEPSLHLSLLLCPQLRALAFSAPLLSSEEWDCLLALTLLTELRINDWRGPAGQPSYLMVPGTSKPDHLNKGFNLRPLLAPGAAGDDAEWLERGLNAGPAAPAAAADPGADPAGADAAGVESAATRPPLAQLCAVMRLAAFSQLHSLRVCLTSPAQLAYLASLPPGVGLPPLLRALHVAFTDAASGDGAAGASSDDTAAGGGSACEGGAPTQQRLPAAIGVAGPQHLQALLAAEPEVPEAPGSGRRSSEAGAGAALWSGLARCCPALTDLNVRRTWSLQLDEPAMQQLALGLPQLRELQFCGAVDLRTAALQLLCRLQWLNVLSLGSIVGPPLVLPTSLIPAALESLSLLNADVVDDAAAGGGDGGSDLPVDGASACGEAGRCRGGAAGSAGRGLPGSLLRLQLKRCRWFRGSGTQQQPGRQPDDAAMLAAVSGCLGLRELRLSFEAEASQAAEPQPGGPLQTHFSLLAPLRHLQLLDLNLAQMPAGYPYAAAVRQVAALTSLHRLHLGVLPRARGWDADEQRSDDGGRTQEESEEEQAARVPSLPGVPQALCSLSGLWNLQTLEIEVLSPPTAEMLEAHFLATLPNCRFTLVVDNFSQMMSDIDKRLADWYEGDSTEDEQQQEELELELAALSALDDE